jgi:hypothetical protein
MRAARRRRIHLVVAHAALVLAAGAIARAEERSLPPPAEPPWQLLRFPRVERASRYQPVEVDGVPAVRAESECSASALLLPVEDVDLRRTPLLRWRWRVERRLDLADERRKEGDDFAARVYLMFRFDPARASWLERARRRVAEVVYGQEIPGNAINYVWSSREPSGAVWDNPYTASSKMGSLGAGPLPEWRSEEVDVWADYRRLFATDPPALVGVALMSDSDDSCGRGVAWLAELRFATRDTQ